MQRAVLEVLDAERRREGHWLTPTEVASRIPGANTHSGRESVRRSIKSLAQAGRLDLDYFDDFVHVREAAVSWGEAKVYRSSHRGTRKVLAAHWPLSVEEREARERSIRDSLDRLTALDRRSQS